LNALLPESPADLGHLAVSIDIGDVSFMDKIAQP
jgi:hypothetical protein